MRKGARDGQVCIEEVGVSAVSEVYREECNGFYQRQGRQWFRATRAVKVDGCSALARTAEAGLFHAQQSIGEMCRSIDSNDKGETMK